MGMIENHPVLELRQKVGVELNDYLRDAKLRSNECHFEYWVKNKEKWPNLFKFFQKLNRAPATSCESERLFSTSGQVLNNLRTSLKPDKLEKLLILHHNLKIIDFEYE